MRNEIEVVPSSLESKIAHFQPVNRSERNSSPKKDLLEMHAESSKQANASEAKHLVVSLRNNNVLSSEAYPNPSSDSNRGIESSVLLGGMW